MDFVIVWLLVGLGVTIAYVKVDFRYMMTKSIWNNLLGLALCPVLWPVAVFMRSTVEYKDEAVK